MSKAFKWQKIYETPDSKRVLMSGTRFSQDQGLKVVFMVRAPEGNTPIMTSFSDAMNAFNKPWSDQLKNALIMSPSRKVVLP